MIRSELVQTLVKTYPGLSPRDVDMIVSVFFDTMIDQLAKGGRVELRGFGTFSARARDGRQGRNPKTGESMPIKASKSVGFKPSSVLKNSL